jgi:hypothetical protein
MSPSKKITIIAVICLIYTCLFLLSIIVASNINSPDHQTVELSEFSVKEKMIRPGPKIGPVPKVGLVPELFTHPYLFPLPFYNKLMKNQKQTLSSPYAGSKEAGETGQMSFFTAYNFSVPINLYIVHGADFTLDEVENHIKLAQHIYHSQGITLNFRYTVQYIEEKTMAGPSLLNISIHDPKTLLAIDQNPYIKIKDSEQVVPLLSAEGKAINIIYTDAIFNATPYGALSYFMINTILVTNKAKTHNFIIAHELIHQFGIRDQYVNDTLLSYGYYNLQTGTALTPADISIIRKHINVEWFFNNN